jgi:pyruvate,orthophosphate dikinase
LRPVSQPYNHNRLPRRLINIKEVVLVMPNKWVYLFSEVEEAEKHAGSWDGVRGLLGGKGANLAEMTRIGVPVPPGFTVTTEACNAYLAVGEQFPEGLWEQELEDMKAVENETGKKFGDAANPLLVSCRSGAKFSMPGMMDTVLNIGLNDETAKGMVELTGDETFVYNSYRRLIQMFGSVVLNIEDEAFEHAISARKKKKGVKDDTELDADDWKALTEEFKAIVREQRGFDFPQDPFEQLKLATEAVFKSWNGKPAIAYRNREKIPHDLGTGVNIVTMVFGNMGWTSGTGVAFTRNPATGEKKLYGDYLMNAQGEDVVAGIRNTKPIAKMEEEMPEVYEQFTDICDRLEEHYREMQDVEFTIEQGKLWMLQTRNGKRTAKAAIKIAVDMADEGLISKEEATKRVTPENVDALLHPQFSSEAKKQAREQGTYLAKGVNASPGAAVGIAAFDADLAEEWGLAGRDVIMIRPETKPDDVHGMIASKGILTSRGGATSHAAVVARQFGTPAVVGCEAIEIDLVGRQMEVNGKFVKEGEWVSIDGTAGEVFAGQIATEAPSFDEQIELKTLLQWADQISAQEGTRTWPEGYDGFPSRGLQVWANADYPRDAQRARSFGAKGIGLCRTEHMFFEEERLPIVQAMILSETSEGRRVQLDKLLPFQRADFEGLFEAMDGLPVIIRLIDPPLHEFLPSKDDLLVEVTELRLEAKRLEKKGKKKKLAKLQTKLAKQETLLQAVEAMEEANPMMGLRGIRLGITMPEITQMQVRAIFEAACNKAQEGIDVHPEIMIPLTGHFNELKVADDLLVPVAKKVMEEKAIEIDYKFGTMIEIPRAAVTADQIADYAEFFSFGTNDLTQMTFGYSRDDAERNFLLYYVEHGILPKNPFQVLDWDGVGELVKWAVRKGRETRPELEVGICGEHGGEPSSIEFCHIAGLNYVSCSPFRVPVARLAAAHAALKHRK